MAKTSALRPLALKVGYLTFGVEYLSDTEWIKNPTLDDSNCGQTQGYAAAIWVRLYDDQDEMVTREILMHEIMHAIFYVTSLVTANPKLMDDWEEETVQRMSPTMVSVLRENPELVAFLIDA